MLESTCIYPSPGFVGDKDPHLTMEWLVTNGLGGYASGTVEGDLTRRYHGLLIAALPNPWGRFLLLSALSERCHLEDEEVTYLGSEPLWSEAGQKGILSSEFRLDLGLPVWKYQVGENILEKRLLLLQGQNTAHITYRLLAGSRTLGIDALIGIGFRPHDAQVNSPLPSTLATVITEEGLTFTAHEDGPELRIACSPNMQRFVEQVSYPKLEYRSERERGYADKGAIFIPGYLKLKLDVGEEITVIASTEPWEMIAALTAQEARNLSIQRLISSLQRVPPCLRHGTAAKLVLAADQFVIRPRGRAREELRAEISGNQLRTVIAGYHWFTDWGRDTMISLEGLTITTGRAFEARWILRTFSQYVKNGLIPNMFPEGTNEGVYHTADASLWFFHALSRYWQSTGDDATLRQIFPVLQQIIDAHIQGTSFGIHVDAKDGLLHQGAEGYQLTWMDAKVGGWVVTPRRGKAVEINALWYNALCLFANWNDFLEGPGKGASIANRAASVRASFNQRFWCEKAGHLYDVVDGENGDDATCRPNQVFAISLPNPVLDQRHWKSVMGVVQNKLLTPVGLRSLSPDDPNYKPHYDGDLRARDAAYHQGSVWPWLIGPYVDAWLKLHPGELSEARELLAPLTEHLKEACVSSISEIFDGELPHTPRGCIAQAWSVAEVLRAWEKTEAR